MNTSTSTERLRDTAILVVDDHPVNREFLRVGLSGVVGRLDLVDSGMAAIERCREHTYHVILMDLHMPQMDGLATANSIRDLDAPSAQARMVLLTADTRPEEQARMIDSGFEACLSKPLSINQLLAALQQVLGPGKAREPAASYAARHDNSAPLVDGARILAAAQGDPATADRLGLMLSSELAGKLSLMDQFIAEGRKREAEDLLHQWTGASGFAGAVRLAQACRNLRQRLLDPAPSSIGTAYTDFLRIARATGEALGEKATRPESG